MIYYVLKKNMSELVCREEVGPLVSAETFSVNKLVCNSVKRCSVLLIFPVILYQVKFDSPGDYQHFCEAS